MFEQLPASSLKSHSAQPEPASGKPRSYRLVKRLVVWAVVTTALGIPPLGTILRKRHLAENLLAHESRLAMADIEMINTRRVVHAETAMPVHSTITQFFETAGIGAPLADQIVRAARPVYNLARIRAGNRIDIIR